MAAKSFTTEFEKPIYIFFIEEWKLYENIHTRLDRFIIPTFEKPLLCSEDTTRAQAVQAGVLKINKLCHIQTIHLFI